MKKFTGKKLLILGTSVGSVDMVKYAQSEGAKVYVADNLDDEKSEAKLFSDVSVKISTTDIDGLYQYCLKENISGIFCGVSETNLQSVIELTSRLHLPCYLTKEHFKLNNDKNYFKKIATKYGIDVPKILARSKEELEQNFKEFKYPVVVKPFDQSSGIGVKICYNPDETLKAFDNALLLSKTGKAFVEEYIEGIEISAIFTIFHGEPMLSLLRDKYLSEDHVGVSSISDLTVAPSKYLAVFQKKYQKKFENLIKNELYRNGTVFFQGIYRDGRIYFLEAGTRISGGADYKNIERVNGNNFMHLLIDYSIFGENITFNIYNENPNFDCVFGIFSNFGHSGIIGSLPKKESFKNIPFVDEVIFSKNIGDEIIEDGSLRQKVFRCYLRCPNIETLKKTILEIQDKYFVLDIKGKDLSYKKFDINRINNISYCTKK